jgi:hypothetical protein
MDQRTRDGDTLLLTAGEFRGQRAYHAFVEAHLAQDIARAAWRRFSPRTSKGTDTFSAAVKVGMRL